MLQAGAGKALIEIAEELFPLEKFTYCHDSLYCRVIILGDFVFVSLDVTSLQDYAITAIKEVVQANHNVLSDHIFISVTHTFSAPHTRSQKALSEASEEVRQKNQLYLNSLIVAVKTALLLAQNHLQSAHLSCQNTEAFAQVNRDIELIDGYWLGKNSHGYSNHTIPVLVISSISGNIIAMIYSVDVQSAVVEKIADGAISSDLMGLTTQKIENELGCVALFMLGAAADQTPNIQDEKETFEGLEQFSNKLALTILSQLRKGKQMNDKPTLTQITVDVEGQIIPDMKTLKPTKQYHFELNGKKEVAVGILTVGDFGLVMLKPELASITGKNIQEHSPFPVTMVATMINGGQKYMVDKKSYDKCTYEAMNSMFARGSAEKVSKSVIEVLERK